MFIIIIIITITIVVVIIWCGPQAPVLPFYSICRRDFNSFPSGFILLHPHFPTLSSLFYKNSWYYWMGLRSHLIQCLYIIHHTLETQKCLYVAQEHKTTWCQSWDWNPSLNPNPVCFPLCHVFLTHVFLGRVYFTCLLT